VLLNCISAWQITSRAGIHTQDTASCPCRKWNS